MRIAKFLIQLVKFHQDTCICRIEIIRLLQRSQCLLRIMLFVIISQRKITQYRRKSVVESNRPFPTCHSIIVTTNGIMEITQIVRSLGSCRVQSHGILQHQDFFQFIGETIIRTHLFCFLIVSQCFILLSCFRREVTQCIIYHRIRILCIFCYKRKQLQSLIIHAGRSIINGIFDITMNSTAHQRLQILLHGRCLFHLTQYFFNQIGFKTASHIEAVHRQGLINQCHCTGIITCLPQEGSLQLTSLMIQPVAIKRTVYMIQSAFIILSNHVDLSQSHITGILPSCIPGSFEESVISAVYITLHLLAPTQVIIWFTVIRIWITFRLCLNGTIKIFLGLGKTSTTHQQQTDRIVTTDISFLTAQGPHVIIHRLIRSMTILFQMVTSQEKLFHACYLLGSKCSLGRLRYRSDLRFIRLITYHHVAFFIQHNQF